MIPRSAAYMVGQLFDAIEHGDAQRVRGLLADRRLNPNARDNAGRTPLGRAVQLRHMEVVRALADVTITRLNEADDAGNTPLDYALDNTVPAHRDPDFDIALYLLKRGAEPAFYMTPHGRTLLHRAAAAQGAAAEDTVKFLMRKRTIDPLQKDADGNTAFDIGTRANRESLKRDRRVWKMLSRRRDAEEREREAAERAEREKPYTDVLSEMREQLDGVIDRYGRISADKSFAEQMCNGMLAEIFRKAAEDGRSKHVRACLEIMPEFYESRVNSAFQWAARGGDIETVDFLLSRGADVHYDDDYALKWAALYGHKDLVRHLVDDLGVDPQADGNAALWNASFYKHFDVVRLLIDRGVDVNAKDGIALTYACAHADREMVEFLLNHGAKVNADDGAALAMAAGYDQVDIVNLLIERGADVNAGNGKPLLWAAEHGALGAAGVLVRHGANIHANDEKALRAACKWGHASMAKFLLNMNADPNAKGGEPLRLARQGRHTEIIADLSFAKLRHDAPPPWIRHPF